MEFANIHRTESARETVFTVTANFTAEPIGDVLRFWFARLGMETSGWNFQYNQVLQQLMAPQSALTSKIPGANLSWCAWRIGAGKSGKNNEWKWSLPPCVSSTRLSPGSPSEHTGLRSWRFCPPSSGVRSDVEFQATLGFLESNTRRYGEVPRSHPRLRGRNQRTLSCRGHRRSRRRPRGPRPFTHAYWVALGTMLVRKARALFQPPHKLIVVDADNTLWDGIVARSARPTSKSAQNAAPSKAFCEPEKNRECSSRLPARTGRRMSRKFFDVPRCFCAGKISPPGRSIGSPSREILLPYPRILLRVRAALFFWTTIRLNVPT